MRIVTIVGARPQFIKAAAVSRQLRQKHTEILVHTGQHYDSQMSAIFFEELNIPKPDVNLEVGSGYHGSQTGQMLARIEELLLREKPDKVLVYGDTNSTLAGALAAAKLHIPVIHVEAGLRSFNRNMPEEVNRVLTDHLSELLLCPSQTAKQNLASEGITAGVHVVGDVMYDVLLFAAKHAKHNSNILTRLELKEKQYILSTIHRAENTDDPRKLWDILMALTQINKTVVFSVHPRTRTRIEVTDGHIKVKGQEAALRLPDTMILAEPFGYIDMIALEQAADMILTDSGGVQKEACWLGIPCLTLRDETEWQETVDTKWNMLVGADTERILDGVERHHRPNTPTLFYGDGHSAEKCVTHITAM